MKPVTAPLKPQMKRPTVAELHKALALLGFPVAATDVDQQRYGTSTRAAVQQFQGYCQLAEARSRDGHRRRVDQHHTAVTPNVRAPLARPQAVKAWLRAARLAAASRLNRPGFHEGQLLRVKQAYLVSFPRTSTAR